MWETKSQNFIEQLGTGKHGLKNGNTNTCYSNMNELTKQQLKEKLFKTKRYKEIGVMPEKLVYPIAVQCELTFRCNLRCIMCYNVSGSARKDSPREKEMTDAEWIAQIEEYCQNGAMEIVISGGEPFLRRNLVFEILKICQKYQVEVMLITNGTYLTEELVQSLLPYRSQFCWIQVSIDGPDAETHEFMRGVKGSWKKSIHGISMLVKYGFPVKIASVFRQMDFNKIPDMVDLAIYLGASEVVLGKVLGIGMGAKNNDKLGFSADGMEEYWKIVEEQICYKGKFIRISPGLETQVQLILQYIEPNFAVVVRPNGDVKIGCAAPFVVGNVKYQTLKEIWDQKAATGYQLPEVEAYVEKVKTIYDESQAYMDLDIPEGEDSVLLY